MDFHAFNNTLGTIQGKAYPADRRTDPLSAVDFVDRSVLHEDLPCCSIEIDTYIDLPVFLVMHDRPVAVVLGYRIETELLVGENVVVNVLAEAPPVP